ncbi:MAG: nucleoside-diphosphate sugar epimerase/dehydratase [Candidatus Acidiferrales bacterium]
MFSDVMLRRRTWFIALFHAMSTFSALLLAWMLRFEFTMPYRELLFASAPILIGIRLGAIRLFNLHRGWWHFSGINEALDILKAVILGTAVFWLLMTALGFSAFPRPVYIIEAVLTAGFLSGGRLLSRLLARSARHNAKSSEKVILIGAGFAASMVIREIQQLGSRYVLLGCLDDDATKRGIRIHGVPVLGSADELPGLLGRHPADQVLIAIPSATGTQMQRFIEICQRAKVGFRTVPALGDAINGKVSIRQIREVQIEDLLGRHPVEMDLESVKAGLAGRVVLVTGVAGSIGSELCRQILTYRPSRVVCVDQSETGIFYLQQELASSRKGEAAVFCVADIGDAERMGAIFKEHSPEVVFHAAAYKHVPIMERNVQEAVKNNVLGLLSLMEVAEENSCRNFVLISSDKAVNPTNVMGATKRVGELILACRNANSMRCVSVRFGNVLGSSGSVIPVLQRQLRNGEPLTITHPEIRRFFMTTREAVSLVLQAFAIGEHGDILVLDMGEAVSILELAKTLIQLSGKTEAQVGIRFIGLREGEKLFEELYFQGEEVSATSRPKIKRVRGKPMAWPVLVRHLRELRASLSVDGAAPVRAKLQEIVPEYFVEANAESPTQNQAEPELYRQVAGRT